VTFEFPRLGASMMAARKAAFSAQVRPGPFDHSWFAAQDLRVTAEDLHKARTTLVDSIVDRLATYPDGTGAGYCLLNGLAAQMPVEAVRELSVTLFTEVWSQYRFRCDRIAQDRDFYMVKTLSADGKIPVGLYGSPWSFKTPHADRNGVLFVHVYGPHVGFNGGEVLLIDALAYTQSHGFTFDEVMTWSDDPGDQKPVLRTRHVEAALEGYGRQFGQLTPDAILFVNNGPEGLLHGATELQIGDESTFSRTLHRVVVRERALASAV